MTCYLLGVVLLGLPLLTLGLGVVAVVLRDWEVRSDDGR